LIDLVHNELPAQQAEQLQKEINGNRELEQEYQLLAQTVVRPDMNVRFPGIRSLYRKERKDAPVIPLWLRYAAAAAVFVFIAWMAFWRSGNSNNTTGNEALANKEKPAGTQPVNSKEPGVQPATTTTVAATSENNVATTSVPATIVKAPLNSSENKTGVVTSFSPERNNNTQAMQNVPGPEQNTAQQPVLVNNEKQPAVLPEKIKEIIETPQVTETVAGNRPQPETNGAAPEQMAGNENGIATGKTEEKDIASVSIAGLPADKIVEKSGLRGVGRKISRFFERKIKNSRNAISIGSFDVALAR
ncbi:MAG: hypothetical protein JNM68_10840, partial [Dinghuibacter sp.]|nr:hypothetical protein [Dinghuibacter sp.]